MQDPDMMVPELHIAQWGNYFDWNQVAHREDAWTACQASLMRPASLVSKIRLIPSPPFDLGRQTTFHRTKFLLFWLGPEDQRKFRRRLSIFFITAEGRRITIMVWRGREERTCRTKINLPAKESNLFFQPMIFFLISSTKAEKWDFLGDPILKTGMPRYWKIFGALWIPKIDSHLWIVLGLHLPKNRLLFWRLKIWPAASW